MKAQGGGEKVARLEQKNRERAIKKVQTGMTDESVKNLEPNP